MASAVANPSRLHHNRRGCECQSFQGAKKSFPGKYILFHNFLSEVMLKYSQSCHRVTRQNRVR